MKSEDVSAFIQLYREVGESYINIEAYNLQAYLPYTKKIFSLKQTNLLPKVNKLAVSSFAPFVLVEHVEKILINELASIAKKNNIDLHNENMFLINLYHQKEILHKAPSNKYIKYLEHMTNEKFVFDEKIDIQKDLFRYFQHPVIDKLVIEGQLPLFIDTINKSISLLAVIGVNKDITSIGQLLIENGIDTYYKYYIPDIMDYDTYLNYLQDIGRCGVVRKIAHQYTFSQGEIYMFKQDAYNNEQMMGKIALIITKEICTPVFIYQNDGFFGFKIIDGYMGFKTKKQIQTLVGTNMGNLKDVGDLDFTNHNNLEYLLQYAYDKKIKYKFFTTTEDEKAFQTLTYHEGKLINDNNKHLNEVNLVKNVVIIILKYIANQKIGAKHIMDLLDDTNIIISDAGIVDKRLLDKSQKYNDQMVLKFLVEQIINKRFLVTNSKKK